MCRYQGFIMKNINKSKYRVLEDMKAHIESRRQDVSLKKSFTVWECSGEAV